MQKSIQILVTLLLFSSIITAPVLYAQSSDSEGTSITTETEDTETSDSSMKKTSAEIKAEREAFREEQKQKREDMKGELDARRQEAKAEREAKKEEFQARLEKLKDQKKAAIIERVDTRLAEKNQRVSERLLGHLDRITRILDTMEEKLEQANGGDTTEVTAAIASARTAVTTAQATVTTQVGKVYSIEIGDEEELKSVVEATVAQFRNDMEVAIQAVKSAHEAAKMAAQALGQYREANPPENSSKDVMDENTETGTVEDTP